ncbi:MAG: phosphoribosylformylglycinamidine synthase I [Candidatus Omnitrophica bacterium]|nr:phosphoribosylformylglycinamidine synthase I [Candidatus Omnitrophota bacterium]
MKKPNVCVLRTGGTNCDKETAFAFEAVGANAEFVHIKALVEGKLSLKEYQIIALPGGFTYGDDIASGKIFANELKYALLEQLKEFVREGKLIIGICNGFQILVKSGLLPGNEAFAQEVSLIINDSGKFEDRWVYLRLPRRHAATSLVKCAWTRGLPEIIYLPVAHGEGKFVVKDNVVLMRLKNNHQIVFQYCDSAGTLSGYPDNPNGSVEHIAGICDETGRIFGLMPHPERHINVTQHPRWEKGRRGSEGDGLQIFRNGVEYIKKNF